MARAAEQGTTLGTHGTFRTLHLLLLALLAFIPTTTATCYYRSGLSADGDGYVQCPGEDFCCSEVEYCETNGLCRDKNNHANGSLTTFAGQADPGPYNYTGLYQTPACAYRAWDGCRYECTSSNATTFNYVWACTDDLLSYCCHAVEDELGIKDCCDSDSRFSLSRPTAVISASLLASSTSTNTKTAAAQSRASTSPIGGPSTSTTSSGNGGGGGLSQSAKIGVGVGVPLGIIFAVAIGVLFWRTQRLQKHLSTQHGANGNNQDLAEANERRWAKPELADSQWVPPSELDANRPARELDGVENERSRKEKQPLMRPVEMS